MRINALLFQILFLTHLQVAAAYYLDRATCEHRATQGGFRVQDIVDAVDEGMNMIRYAEWRTQNNDPQIGDVINHMLGANGKQALLGMSSEVLRTIEILIEPARSNGTSTCRCWPTLYAHSRLRPLSA
jgi:hypothetical protein